MPKSCAECMKNQEINYEEAVKRFDININRIMGMLYFCIFLMFICVFITAIAIVDVIKFMDKYEIVEETCYEIKQDDGTNTAIISNGESEVRLYEPN